ncbi:hypothetical protein [Streptomyces sp. NPDC088719]
MRHAWAVGTRSAGAMPPAVERFYEAGQSATEYGQEDHQFP